MDFYQKLSEYYDVIFPANPVQVQFIQQQAGKGRKILDVAAGTGSLAIALAKVGYSVTALDLEENMVKQMQRKKNNENVELDTICLDMRNVDQFANQSFELVCCLGNSIVHLCSFEEIQDTVKKMSALLKKGGKVIIQTVNYDRVLKQGLDQLPLIEREGVIFERTYEFSDPHIKFHGKLVVDGSGDSPQIYESTTELLPLTSADWIKILNHCGFQHIELWGSFRPDPFSGESPAIIVVATK